MSDDQVWDEERLRIAREYWAQRRKRDRVSQAIVNAAIFGLLGFAFGDILGSVAGAALGILMARYLPAC